MAGTGEFFVIGVILCGVGLLMIGLSYVPLSKKMLRRK